MGPRHPPPPPHLEAQLWENGKDYDHRGRRVWILVTRRGCLTEGPNHSAKVTLKVSFVGKFCSVLFRQPAILLTGAKDLSPSRFASSYLKLDSLLQVLVSPLKQFLGAQDSIPHHVLCATAAVGERERDAHQLSRGFPNSTQDAPVTGYPSALPLPYPPPIPHMPMTHSCRCSGTTLLICPLAEQFPLQSCLLQPFCRPAVTSSADCFSQGVFLGSVARLGLPRLMGWDGSCWLLIIITL